MSNAFLKVMSGPKEGTNIPLESGAMVIGRRSGDIIIPDPLISSKHAKIFQSSDGWYIEDLHSRNGLTVDGKLTQRCKLKPGSEIVLGNSILVLFVGLPPKDNSPVAKHNTGGIEVAWMLDEELESNQSTQTIDVISNELRVPPNFQADLEVINGLDMGEVYTINTGTITIGRQYGEVPLSDPEISRKHAVLEIFSRDMIFLRDLQSTNGTYHNGRSIQISKLQNADTIGLGSSLLRLRIRN